MPPPFYYIVCYLVFRFIAAIASTVRVVIVNPVLLIIFQGFILSPAATVPTCKMYLCSSVPYMIFFFIFLSFLASKLLCAFNEQQPQLV